MNEERTPQCAPRRQLTAHEKIEANIRPIYWLNSARYVFQTYDPQNNQGLREETKKYVVETLDKCIKQIITEIIDE
jgi:hypothetical protein